MRNDLPSADWLVETVWGFLSQSKSFFANVKSQFRQTFLADRLEQLQELWNIYMYLKIF
jgi:hypothetical protein